MLITLTAVATPEPRTLAHPAFILGALLLILAAMTVDPAYAQESSRNDPQQQKHFDIQAQPLDHALVEYSLASGVQILADGALTAGKTSPRVSGDYTPAAALEQLLAGAGLRPRFNDNGAVSIERVTSDPMKDLMDEARKPLQLAEAPDKPPPPAKKAEEGPTTLPEITVTASPLDDSTYNPPNATTATKTDTPIMETPASINVITRAQLDDRKVLDVREAFKYTSGVNPASGERGPYNGSLTLRGFSNEEQPTGTGSFIYRDGFRTIGVPVSIANIERLELLKGPATVLYGRAEPGGLVNAVFKRPLATPYYSVEQQFGSFDRYRTSVDATGPVTPEGSVRYRFGLEYTETDSFRDFVFNNLLSVAPSLSWKPNENTEFNLQFEYNHSEWTEEIGIPAIGTRPAPVPLTRYFGEPFGGEPTSEQDDYIVDFNMSHAFNDDWTAKAYLLYARQEFIDFGVTGSELDETTGELSRSIFFKPDPDPRQWWFTSLNVTGKFSLFGMTHKPLFGFDYNHDEIEPHINFLDGGSINIFNPAYGLLPKPQKEGTSLIPILIQNEGYGFYLQDQIELLEGLHLVLGGRYDDVDSFANRKFLFQGQGLTNHTALSPRYGIVYQPAECLSLYFQYVEAFGAHNRTFSLAPDQLKLDPETSQQFEGGIKAELFDGRLSSTLAVYDLTKQNIVTPHPTDPERVVLTGEANSFGVELDITGKLTDRVSLIGSYAYTDTEVIEGANAGNRLFNVPRHAGALWAAFEAAENFKVGAGLYLAGEREGDLENDFQLPGYVRVDAMAAYTSKLGPSRLTAQININNLLDKEYFAYSTGTRGNGAIPGDELTVLGSIRLEY